MEGLKKDSDKVSSWCDGVASLVVDAMVDAEFIKTEDIKKAIAVASEEIHVRLALDDYPPHE